MTAEMPDQSWNPPILFGTNLRLLNEALSADAVRRLNNAWDVASFVVAMLRKVDLISEADAVGRILAGSEKVNKAKKERPEFSEPTSAKRLEARGRRTGQVETGPPAGAAPRDSMQWFCHECGTSKRHPLADGCPACVECGKPMVSDRHLSGRIVAGSRTMNELQNNQIACPDCRARALYRDAWDAWDDDDRDGPEPIEPQVPKMRLLSHDELECRRCGNIVVVPDL
jgi:RNase P subunit RPR2